MGGAERSASPQAALARASPHHQPCPGRQQASGRGASPVLAEREGAQASRDHLGRGTGAGWIAGAREELNDGARHADAGHDARHMAGAGCKEPASQALQWGLAVAHPGAGAAAGLLTYTTNGALRCGAGGGAGAAAEHPSAGGLSTASAVPSRDLSPTQPNPIYYNSQKLLDTFKRMGPRGAMLQRDIGALHRLQTAYPALGLSSRKLWKAIMLSAMDGAAPGTGAAAGL